MSATVMSIRRTGTDASAMTSLADKADLAKRLCRDKRLSDAQCRVGIALLFTFHNTTTGQCNPSYRQLAEASRTSPGTVLRAIESLEAAGYLVVERSNGGRNQRNSYLIKHSTGEAFADGNTPLVEQKHSTGGASCSTGGARNTPLVIDAKNTGKRTRERTHEGTQYGMDAFLAFQQLASEVGLPVPREPTKSRLTKINKLVVEHEPEAWQQALDEIRSSRFLCGSNGWKLTLDWLVKPANFPKVIEGNYRSGTSRCSNSTSDFIDRLQNAKGEFQQ